MDLSGLWLAFLTWVDTVGASAELRACVHAGQAASWYDSRVRSRLLGWLIVVLLTLVCMSSCAQPPDDKVFDAWTYGDLKALDPDNAATPAYDLIAVYMRQKGERLQVRFDLLETGRFDEFDLYLALDTMPGGRGDLPLLVEAQIDWDTLITVQAHGSISVQDADGGYRPGTAVFVLRDPRKDAILLDLDLRALNPTFSGFKLLSPLRMQVFLTPEGSPVVADQSSAVSAGSPPPPPAHALIAFWNTYPAYTPATALRRWDGAHTGPYGGRHGLYNLLRTASASKTPLFMLDLKDPAALSTLDFSGGLALVKELEQAGLLEAPIPLRDPRFSPLGLTAEAQEVYIAQSEAIGDSFAWTDHSSLYLPPGAELPATGSQVIFLRTPIAETAGIDSPASLPSLYPLRRRSHLVVPLYDQPSNRGFPASIFEQATWDGLGVEWRRALVSLAIRSPETGGLPASGYISLGGDLAASSWGDPRAARATFQWLKDHPWIEVLDDQDLLEARSSRLYAYGPGQRQDFQAVAPSPQDGLSAALHSALRSAPDNPLSLAAWQAYWALYAPVYPAPPELPVLRANYTGQVWSLLEAARWAETPGRLATCVSDPDQDGQPECLLASEQMYAQFEIDDGSLTYLFTAAEESASPSIDGNREGNGVHQLIGPSSQFITGLSDRAAWDPNAGLQADAGVIAGAFTGPGKGYQAEWQDEMLVFSLPGAAAVKSFQLTDHGLAAVVRLALAEVYPEVSIPLALDPWRRFTPGWADQYRSVESDRAWRWELGDGPGVEVRTSSILQGTSFLASRPLFAAPENPNQDFPAGYSLPFPLALVEVSGQSQFQVQIEAKLQPLPGPPAGG